MTIHFEIPIPKGKNLVITLLAGTLILGCILGYLEVRSFDAKLAQANAAYVALQTSKKALDKTDQEATAKRQTLTQDQTAIQKSMADQHKIVDTQRAKVLAPQSIESIQSQADRILGYKPVISNDLLAFDTPVVQKVLADEVDHTQLIVDNQNLTKLFHDEQAKSESLSGELTKTQTQLASTEALTAQYKKLATRSKKQKFLDGLEKVGIAVGAGYLGYVLPH